MRIKSLTYTSMARLDLSAADLDAIHVTARDLNALDGVTGLLVFNGTHFLQIVEGAETAIDDLVERLRRDPRHSGLEIRDERFVAARSFPDWSMDMVRVSTDGNAAKSELDNELPLSVDADVRTLLVAMTQSLSGDVRMD